MALTQVLVIHGVANHDEGEFVNRVKTLNAGFPLLAMLPVFWGDVGGDMLGLADTIPPAVDDQGSDEALRQQLAGGQGSDQSILEGESWVDVVSGACQQEATAEGGALAEGITPTTAELRTLIAAASDDLVHLPRMSRPVLERAGRVVGRALREAEPRSDTDDVDAELRWPGFVHDLLRHIDGLIGEVLGTGVGLVNSLVRSGLLPFLAAGIGDAFVYQRHVDEVQARLQRQLAKAREVDPAYGTEQRPIDVIAHSLGGLIAFDAAVSPALQPNLRIRHLITFGTQVSAFHVFDHLGRGLPAYVPPTPVDVPAVIGTWTNLWEPMDPLAFRMSKVFRLADGEIDEDFVPHLISAGVWTHSAYWTSDELRQAVTDRIIAGI
jgi:hypothetical protein